RCENVTPVVIDIFPGGIARRPIFENGESLPWLREGNRGRANSLCSVCDQQRNPTPYECGANGASGSTRTRGSCEPFRIRTAPCTSTFFLGCVQATGLAHQRILFPTNSAAPRVRFDIGYSLPNRSLTLVCKSNSSGLPLASTALAGANATRRTSTEPVTSNSGH